MRGEHASWRRVRVTGHERVSPSGRDLEWCGVGTGMSSGVVTQDGNLSLTEKGEHTVQTYDES